MKLTIDKLGEIYLDGVHMSLEDFLRLSHCDKHKTCKTCPDKVACFESDTHYFHKKHATIVQ